jgi:hypothetical protein
MTEERAIEETVAVADSHLFICHSSKDEAVAREVVAALEADGLKCWISERDVLPGENYQEAIVQALEAASGIVFLFSENSNKSLEIKKELSLGGSISVPVFPLRLSPIAPSGALRYELAVRQWIDIFPDREHALSKLARTIKNTIDGSDESEDDTTLSPAPGIKMDAATKRPAVQKAAPAPRAPIVASNSAQFEAIRALLARHIGPIAKLFVEKAANEARTPEEFCEQLATRVPAAADRTSFVQAVRKQLAAKP